MRKQTTVKPVRLLAQHAHGAAGQVVALRRIIRSDSAISGFADGLSRREKAREYIRRLELVLEEQTQHAVTLTGLAYILDLERTYCSRIFRGITGKSFSAWIRGIRIRKARSLLLVPTHTITEISHLVGYPDLTTFERNFRRELGLCPISFRQSIPDLPAGRDEPAVRGELLPPN